MFEDYDLPPLNRDEIDWDNLDQYDPSQLEDIGIHYDAAFAALQDDDIPEGCRACGNPDYPKCCDSCPIFDD